MSPVIIELRPSRQLVFVLMLVHCAAIGAVLALTLPWLVRLALVAVVLASFVSAIHKLRRQTPVRLLLGEKSQCEVQTLTTRVGTNVGAGETACVAPETTLYPGCVVLVLQVAGNRQTYMILPDSTDADAGRRLRIWLGRLS